MKGLNSVFLRVILSFIVTIILGTLFFTLEQPYSAQIVEKREWALDKNTSYYDLDSDGKTERILLSNSAIGQTGIIVYDDQDRTIDQYNLPGKYVKRSLISRGDYDNNGFSELYTFTYIGDSLFLNIIDVYNLSDPLLSRRYIDGCESLHGEAQQIITGPIFEDVNDDGYLEFYFAISAGFTLQPRSVYYYNIVDDNLEKSPSAGSAPRYFLRSYDLDDDGKVELWGISNAVGNYKTAFPYSDSSAWLMIYDNKLDYKFEPYEFKGFGSVVSTVVLKTKDEIKLVATRSIESIDDKLHDELAIFSSTGELLEEKNLKEFGISSFMQAFTNDEKIYLIDEDGRLFIFDQRLNLIKQDEKASFSGRMYGPFNMNDPDEDLVLFKSPNGELNIYDLDLKKLASLELGDLSSSYTDPVYISKKGVRSGFHLRTSNYDYAIELVRNKARNYIFLYVLLMFGAFYFLIYFIQLFQHKQEEKKRFIEAKMRALQLQAIKSQMSPHFIFNALNSISAMYIKGDTSRADTFLTSFSKMIREVLDSSDRLLVKIIDEMEFVRNYLELEQVRHEKNLTFTINVQDECKDLVIPSMSVHTFVENSIKHGFRGKQKMHIQINTVCINDLITISIKDDGIGYKKSRTDEGREGRGLKMISDIFSTYHSISGKRIDYTISDLGEIDSENCSGSLVEINAQI